MPDDDVVSQLRRWEDSGAMWRVVRRPAGSVTVALCRCDGGEEVGRITSTEPAVLRYIGERASSEEDP